jgi:F-type H+-transporting ATPase subunit gamma
MTHLHDLERHRHSLAEIRSILNSMKTLAYMETRKLGRYLESQQAVVDSIEEAATDLLTFYPDILPANRPPATAYLLIGTERGFCGDFNHALPRRLESLLDAHPIDPPTLIAVGHKLNVLLEDDPRVAARIEGASVAEEVTAVLNPVVAELSRLQEALGLVHVRCLYHVSDEEIVVQELLPPFEHLRHATPRFAHPPLLNQPPGDLLVELTEHYLFAVLHQFLYTSLMAENHHRIAHLDGAVRHLDDEAADLARRCNALRQEEIVEEIEVILLSAASLGAEPGNREH